MVQVRYIRVIQCLICLNVILYIFNVCILRRIWKQQRNFQDELTTDSTLSLRKTGSPTGSISDDITMVSAYFNLGTISKSLEGNYVTERMYFRWSRTLCLMTNPLMIYTDCNLFYTFIKSKCQKDSSTKIMLIKRNSSWAFQNERKIKTIISYKDYPMFVPNTVNSAYICSQYAKYDVIEWATRLDPFNTKYFAWIDLGYFRARTTQNRFRLHLPPNFNETQVAVNQVFQGDMSIQPDRIFKENLVWIGGGLFLGQKTVITQYAEQFRRSVTYFMSKGLVNTDQQVTYAMFSDTGRRRLNPGIEVQRYYKRNGSYIVQDWFYLGYKMLHSFDPS